MATTSSAMRTVDVRWETRAMVRPSEASFRDLSLYTMVHETSQERFEALKEQLKAMIEPVKYCDLRTAGN